MSILILYVFGNNIIHTTDWKSIFNYRLLPALSEKRRSHKIKLDVMELSTQNDQLCTILIYAHDMTFIIHTGCVPSRAFFIYALCGVCITAIIICITLKIFARKQPHRLIYIGKIYFDYGEPENTFFILSSTICLKNAVS